MINVTKTYLPSKEKYQKYVDKIFKSGWVTNIGGHNERTNLQIVDAICSILDEKVPARINKVIQNSSLNIQHCKDLVVFVKDRAGHDRRYAIDANKIENELEWKADENFESGIVKTVDWYFEKYNKVTEDRI